MKNKMCLANEIIARLGYLNLNNIDEERDYPVIKYFLDENFKLMFGKSEFDSDEIDFTTTKEENRCLINLKTIFEEDVSYTIKSSMTAEGINVIECETNDPTNTMVFKLGIGSNKAFNSIMVKEKDQLRYREYTCSTDGFMFNYATGIYGCKPTYEGMLSSVNAKHKEKEIFEYQRIIPPVEEEKSILKRIADAIKGEGYISITTSEELCNNIEYIDQIFGKLIEEEKKLTATSDSLKLKNEA